MSWAAKYTEKRAAEPTPAFAASPVSAPFKEPSFKENIPDRKPQPWTYKPKAPVPLAPTPNIDSAADFPILGGKKTTIEQKPKQTGFASLAKAWAQQDADQRAVEEAERAEEERIMKRRAYEESMVPDIYSARLRNQLTYRSQLNEPYEGDYDHYDRPYTPQYNDDAAPAPPKDEWSHVEK
jgi:hypothetical protein